MIITTYVIISLLVLISALSKAIMDTLSFHFSTSVFKNLGDWWNPDKSWQNKYNWFPKSKILTWLFSEPLVGFTDAWHFFGALQRISLFCCLFFTPIWWSIPIFYIGFALVFDLFYTHIFVS